MKKWMFVLIIVNLVLACTACGSAQTTTVPAAASNTLSLEGQLLVGTFKLENTALAVTSSQATTLLPLWETLASLASSNTAASQEVDAVVSQIESSMSTQLVSSITAMQLTQSDLAATAIDTGTTSTAANTAKTGSSQQPAGGPSGGNPPSGLTGGGMPGGTDVQSISQAQTTGAVSQAAKTPSAAITSQVSAAMLKAVVELLQKKIG